MWGAKSGFPARGCAAELSSTCGVISAERIEGEPADLVSGRVTGRCHEQEIILFKSVGSAIEDLAAAQMIVEGARR